MLPENIGKPQVLLPSTFSSHKALPSPGFDESNLIWSNMPAQAQNKEACKKYVEMFSSVGRKTYNGYEYY